MTKLVLFDFDGTLADSAPDLAATANRFRAEQGLDALPYDILRPYSSQGARGLLKAALDMDTTHPDYLDYRERFLADYASNMTQLTTLFEGVDTLLERLQDDGYSWGIVTNKLEYLALPLIEHLGLAKHCRITVGGDTTAYTKPHPAPLLYAAEKAGFEPADCIYIGDDERDIVAAHAAGMASVVAAYGYCLNDPNINNWNALAVSHTVDEIWPVVKSWAQP